MGIIQYFKRADAGAVADAGGGDKAVDQLITLVGIGVLFGDVD